ncbi:hypothetical protein YYC_04095 [Plasmodium yoelii 17X]|uniref:Plasmodium RESA N-terminal domain-containing protein n=4 Tax=Plasmodium yoelii TaxID=5861 RepID=A0AAF0B148_PLAYO|eukprot:XP_727230.1 Plasmodium exported protein, unknown function [Plasmodium yoelii]
MIAVILNLAIFTFLHYGTHYQQPGINCYHNLAHTNIIYHQNIKQNGGYLKRILRAVPQDDVNFLRDVTTHVDDELEGISPETLALYPMLPGYSFPIINEFVPQENFLQNTVVNDNNEAALLNYLTEIANGNNNTAPDDESSNDTTPSVDSDFIMDRLNLIYSMDERWASLITDMFTQYNNLSEAFNLTQETILVVWNESWRPRLEAMLNTIVTLFENYNMSTPEVEAEVLEIIERAKAEFQIFLNSTRIALQTSFGSDNNDELFAPEV